MSDQKHVELVKRGAKAIAQWKKEHPNEHLDFTREDFSNISLADMDLRDADFSGATLIGADFTGADLSGTHLRDVKLTIENLKGANMTHSDLDDAGFCGKTKITLQQLEQACEVPDSAWQAAREYEASMSQEN